MKTNSTIQLRHTTAIVIALWAGFFADRCFSQQMSAVSVAQPIRTQSADFDFTGTLEPAGHADVRAAVDGNVKEVNVKNGDVVAEGQLLMRLDDRALEQRIETANSEIGKLKAQLEQLDAKLAKARKAAGDDAEADIASITADRDLVAANVQLNAVDLQQLRDDLEATKITAPIAGRVSGLSLGVGDAVRGSAVSATLVCQITQTNPVRACFSVDQTTLAELRKLKNPATAVNDSSSAGSASAGSASAGSASPGSDSAGSAGPQPSATDAGAAPKTPSPRPGSPTAEEQAACRLTMAIGDEPDYKYHGTLDYVSAEADPQTGEVRVCAVFPNADGKLDPIAKAGQEEDREVRIRLDLHLPQAVLLVSDLAVGQDPDRGSFVLAVNEQHKIEFCPVTLGPEHRGMKVIVAGLKPDQWIVLGTPATQLTPMDASLSPIEFSADVRFGNLQSGDTVQIVKVPMPTPGNTLRDKTRVEAGQPKATKK